MRLWEDSLAVRGATKVCREAVAREARTQTTAAVASVFRGLLTLEFHIARDILVSEITNTPMTAWQLHSLRVAQLAVEANLIRAGVPPAYLCAFQNEMIKHLGELCEPLNMLARRRILGKRQWLEKQTRLDTTRAREVLEKKFAMELSEDKKGKRQKQQG